MFTESLLHQLTLEYLKAKYNIADLSPDDYFNHYLEIYNELKNLNKAQKSKLASNYLNSK
ncbi:hypothetical protein [Clostridium kluyveri]|uniref:hypothetical protein n=1 Tax=Clostridium kluyveri TaxID=1534 RepID=UPI0022478344|nr:hypothetical protein [Clostridium kluyveri]UZQ50603.1 hypothetical protein OP486_22215 [Clostridium kluyveri]UZQ51620.1 hypothetical protein OP486_05415 [Clostridium kluyveri]